MNKIMKSYTNKIFQLLCLALVLTFTSCIGDLDLTPKNPNQLTPDKFKDNPSAYLMQAAAKCYAGIAFSGQGGPNGDSDISGLDGGTSQYFRTLYMLNTFSTDESIWMYSSDSGVNELVVNTWGDSNVAIFAAYSRFYVHIAICNEFLRLTEPANLAALEISVDADLQTDIDQYRIEARALRAMSYYNVIDAFGNTGFIDDKSPAGTNPVQKPRAELYEWLVTELNDIAATMKANQAYDYNKPIYGRVGVDGVEALLARTYLNGQVFAGVNDYAKCAATCEGIIARHQGTGFKGTGLASNYLYLFCATNDSYLPGGSNEDGNEILWGVPYNLVDAECYGGTQFLIAGAISDGAGTMLAANYGMSAQWGCMHATKEFSQKFTENDKRWSMWSTDKDGFSIENTNFTTFTDGYAAVKFTNLIAGENGEWSTENGGIYDPTGVIPARANAFPDTDLPILRLADIYLMYAESNIMGGAGDAAKALTYANYVRERAGVSAWTATDMTADNMCDERCRELYWENSRRTDLIRFGKYTGSTYNWSWKGNVVEGKSIGAYRNIFPIPADVLAIQTDFVQNAGY